MNNTKTGKVIYVNLGKGLKSKVYCGKYAVSHIIKNLDRLPDSPTSHGFPKILPNNISPILALEIAKINEKVYFINPSREWHLSKHPDWLKQIPIPYTSKKLYVSMAGTAQAGYFIKPVGKVRNGKTYFDRMKERTRQRHLRILEEAGLIYSIYRVKNTTVYGFLKPEPPPNPIEKLSEDDLLKVTPHVSIAAPIVAPMESPIAAPSYIKYKKASSNIPPYGEILERTTRTNPNACKHFLSLFPADKQKTMDPRTIIEGIVDALCHSDEIVMRDAGIMNWLLLEKRRKMLISAYLSFDRRKADAFVKTLLPVSQDRYIEYPNIMISLNRQGICPGFDPDYVEAKANMIIALSDCMDKSDTGSTIKNFHKVLRELYHKSFYLNNVSHLETEENLEEEDKNEDTHGSSIYV